MNEQQIKCPKCGSMLNPDSVFCEKCGIKLDSPNFCRNCGEKIEEDMLFCPSCGIPLYEQNVASSNKPKSRNKKTVKKVIIAVASLLAVLILIIVLTQSNKPNFQKAFEQAGGKNYIGEWVTVSGDGKSLRIDTNPGDIDDYYDSDALSAIRKIHRALGLPDSLISKMTQTRAIDGRRTEKYDNMIVSWTYHPNHGLEIIYEGK